jgi:hypothetical protein
MTRTITILIMVSFVAIAVFGFLGIEFMTSHHAPCIVSTSQGAKCPEESGPFAYVNFHLNALRSFSTAVFHSNPAFSALVLFLVLSFSLVSGFSAVRESVRERSIATPRLKADLNKPTSPLLMRLWSWLSLHENSPAVA